MKKIILLMIILYIIFLEHQEWTSMNKKILHASQCCETLCQYVEKFGYLIEKKFEKEIDLIMPSSGILLKDAWNNPFQIDIKNFKIFSKGPDNISNTDDDIFKYYSKLNDELTLTNAKIEINPSKIQTKNKAYDILHLYFNKNIYLSEKVNINLRSASFVQYPGYNNEDTAAVTSTFRYYDKISKNLIPSPSYISPDNNEFIELPSNMQFASDGNIHKSTLTGLFYWGNDSNEVLLRFQDGCSNIILPSFHCINITGSSMIKNKTFKKSDSKNINDSGACAFDWPIIISAYDKINNNLEYSFQKIYKLSGVNLESSYHALLPNGLSNNNQIKLCNWIDKCTLPNKPNAKNFENTIALFIFNDSFDYKSISIKIARFNNEEEAKQALIAVYPYGNNEKIFENFDKNKINNGLVKIHTLQYPANIYIVYKNYACTINATSIYGLYNFGLTELNKLIIKIASVIDKS